MRMCSYNKQAEIELLHDEKDQMAKELRKLRQANACASHCDEELLRLKQDLAEARRRIKSLQVRVVRCIAPYRLQVVHLYRRLMAGCTWLLCVSCC